MKNLIFWISAAALICGVVAIASGAGDEGPIPELSGAVGWLNSTQLSSKSLRGKVVLVNFWTYSCINSLRELPYMKAWAAKYKDAGLVVIGVHTPEFGFEKDPANVKNAVSDLKIGYPSPSTATIRSGRHSATSTGPPTTSSIGKGESVITTSAKANMRSPNALSKTF
jgi:thiol-disulfide isomerase/thioredoxin